MQKKIVFGILSSLFIISVILTVLCFSIPPLQLKKQTFVYEHTQSGFSTNLSDYVLATDIVLENAKLNLDGVINEVGIYRASITYNDQEFPFTIKIEDTTKPIASLKNVSITLPLGKTLEASSLVEIIDNSFDCSVYFVTGETREESKTYNQEGIFIENLIVVDKYENQSALLRIKIEVTDLSIKPYIRGIDTLTIKVGSKFDPIIGVYGDDGRGNDITKSIEILKNDVDTSIPGEYEVIYWVVNDIGNIYQRPRRIIVE